MMRRGGGRRGKGRATYGGEHVHDGEDPGAPVGEGHLGGLGVRGLVPGAGIADAVGGEALDGDELLLGGEPLGCRRPVGEDVPGEDAWKGVSNDGGEIKEIRAYKGSTTPRLQ